MVAKKLKKRKQFSQTLIFSIVLCLFTLGVIGFLVISNVKMNQKRTELTARIELLKKQIEELEKKNSEIKSGISQTQTQDYLEKEARERLNLKKPGENVVTILSPKEGEESHEKEPKNFWEKLWEQIKSKIKK